MHSLRMLANEEGKKKMPNHVTILKYTEKVLWIFHYQLQLEIIWTDVKSA